MDGGFDVSVVIPTYNRSALVQRAIQSVLAQTEGRHEIIVVDDGSTDGTAGALEAAFGDRVHVVVQANAGVSAARNAGLRRARADLIALLDSDDLWDPDKTRHQKAWLDAHPDYGMVLCDVLRVDANGAPIDVMKRRDVIREDGWILRWILRNPSLVPASAMFRRRVLDDAGAFDESLKTAEDLDFHLRVASRWKVGVVEMPLVTAMRGHEGLSMCATTYDDYVMVVERAISSRAIAALPLGLQRQALHDVYARNARGMLFSGRWRDAWRLAAKAARNASSVQDAAKLAELGYLAARCIVGRTLRMTLSPR